MDKCCVCGKQVDSIKDLGFISPLFHTYACSFYCHTLLLDMDSEVRNKVALKTRVKNKRRRVLFNKLLSMFFVNGQYGVPEDSESLANLGYFIKTEVLQELQVIDRVGEETFVYMDSK